MFKLVYDSAARVIAHERRDPRYAFAVPEYRWMVDLVRAALAEGGHGTGLHAGRLSGVRLSWSRSLGLADVHYDRLHLGVSLVVPGDELNPLRAHMAASLFATKARLLNDAPACHAPAAFRHVELTKSPLSVGLRLPPAGDDGGPLAELCDVAEEVFYVAYCEHTESAAVYNHPRLRGQDN